MQLGPVDYQALAGLLVEYLQDSNGSAPLRVDACGFLLDVTVGVNRLSSFARFLVALNSPDPVISFKRTPIGHFVSATSAVTARHPFWFPVVIIGTGHTTARASVSFGKEEGEVFKRRILL